eukprot:8528870-Lingulodinium_polyedra.AAC.1
MKAGVWARAARHWKGSGAEAGLDLRALRLQLAGLLRRGNHEWHGLIHAVATAATWARERRHGIDPRVSPICVRCDKGEVETD